MSSRYIELRDAETGRKIHINADNIIYMEETRYKGHIATIIYFSKDTDVVILASPKDIINLIQLTK